MLPDLANLAFRSVVPCVEVAIGGSDTGQWDDELSSWPEKTSPRKPRRIAFVTVCAALITLIILTIVFVGNDKERSHRRASPRIRRSLDTESTIGLPTISLPVLNDGHVVRCDDHNRDHEYVNDDNDDHQWPGDEYDTTTTVPMFMVGQSHVADGTYAGPARTAVQATRRPSPSRDLRRFSTQPGTLRI